MDRYVAFGEIMLRLKSPGFERFFQSPTLEATFGGGEANVAVSLAGFGENADFVTALPDNDIAKCAVAELRKHGVGTSFIVSKAGRVGIYYLESGADQRPSKVVYDRAYSSVSMCNADDFDAKAALSGATWFHVTGITPALSQGCADATLAFMKTAKELGVTVSIDLNYRKKLWKYGKSAQEVMSVLTRYADVVIANEEDIQKSLGISLESDSLAKDENAYKDLTDKVKKDYPNVSVVAVTLRQSVNANRNIWRACINGNDGFAVSRSYDITDIVDRVGGGDSFAAGLIYGLSKKMGEKGALEFAVAASALKHTIPGDFNLVSVDEVKALCGGDGTGRIQR